MLGAPKKGDLRVAFFMPAGSASIPLEEGYGFHMRGLREHVRDTGPLQAVALFVDEHRGIPGQGCGVAGHVNDPRRCRGTKGLDHRDCPLPRGVDEHFIQVTKGGNAVFGGLEQVGRVELAARLQPVGAGVLACSPHQRIAPLHANHPGTRFGDGTISVTIGSDGTFGAVEVAAGAVPGHRLKLWNYHAMRTLYDGLWKSSNFVSVVKLPVAASETAG